MGQSAILQIEELAQGMTQAFQAVNDGVAALEQVMNLPFDADASGAPTTDYELDELDLVRFRRFIVSGQTAEIDFIIPSLINGSLTPNVYREILVTNDSAFTLIVRTDDPGTTVTVPPNSTRTIHVVLVDCVEVGQSGSYISGTVLGPYTVATYFSGTPGNSEEMMAYAFAEKVSFVDDFVTKATGSVVFTAQPDDGDTVTIDDGVNTPVTFEFESGGGVGGGNTSVTIGASFSDTATNLRTAINAAALNVVAGGAAGTVSLTNNYGAGGSISATSASPDFTVTDWSGGFGWRARVGVLPTATTTLTVQRNGSPIGTIVFDTAGFPVFATTGGTAEVFEVGDIMTIVNQASADATAAGFAITAFGERVL